MIVTEFRERVLGSARRRVVGSLTVDEATDEHFVSGALHLEDISIVDPTTPGGRLWLRDNPARWARICSRAFRSGYLVAVVVADTVAGVGQPINEAG